MPIGPRQFTQALHFDVLMLEMLPPTCFTYRSNRHNSITAFDNPVDIIVECFVQCEFDQLAIYFIQKPR